MKGLDKLGLGLGVAGMLLCFVGLGIGISSNATNGSLFEASPALLLSRPFAAAVEMLLYIGGALLLVVSALTAGKGARLLQIQEVALCLSGAVWFVVHDEQLLFLCRVIMLIAMIVILTKLGLLQGWLNKVGGVGLESLNWGYMFNAAAGFALGGLLLSIFSVVRLRRYGGWVNGLWLGLNLPFMTLAFVRWSQELAVQTSWRETGEILAAISIGAVVAIIGFMGTIFRNFRLEGRSVLADDGVISFFRSNGGTPFVEGADGLVVSNRQQVLLRDDLARFLVLHEKVLEGAANSEMQAEFERLTRYLREANGFVVDARLRHRVETHCDRDLLLVEPTAAMERVDLTLRTV